jgi:nucleotide-binding universal stress UspA family protein
MKILIATDGSDFSRNAVQKAGEMLFDKNADILIRIISVYEEVPRTATEPFAVSAEFIHEMEKIGREQAGKFVEEAENLIREKYLDSYLELTGKTIKGYAGRTIVEEAEEWEADIIVVGSHGRGFWGRAFLGSTSDTVVHHAPSSVLVIKSHKIETADLRDSDGVPDNED